MVVEGMDAYRLAVKTVEGIDLDKILRVIETLEIDWEGNGVPTREDLSKECLRLLDSAIVGATELSKTSTASNGYTVSSKGLVANAFHDRQRDTIVCKISYVVSQSTSFM